jgi:methoxymalonate biosynthesis acyl carrier protein
MMTAELIRDFVVRSLPGMTPESIGVDTRLLDDRILDSLTLLKLILFLEKRFGIQVSEEEINHDNFASVGTIAELVTRKAANHGC